MGRGRGEALQAEPQRAWELKGLCLDSTAVRPPRPPVFPEQSVFSGFHLGKGGKKQTVKKKWVFLQADSTIIGNFETFTVNLSGERSPQQLFPSKPTRMEKACRSSAAGVSFTPKILGLSPPASPLFSPLSPRVANAEGAEEGEGTT